MNDFAFKQDAPGYRCSVDSSWVTGCVLSVLTRESIARFKVVSFALRSTYDDRIGLAKARRRFDECVEHCLQIKGRAADYLEHVGGRRLLLQRFAKVVEQTHVLDGDYGLPGKIVHQLDMLVGEGANLLAVDADRADQVIVLQHRHDDDCTRTTEISEGGSCRIVLEVRRLCLKIFNVHHLLRPDDFGMAASRMGTHRLAPPSLGKCRRYIV